VFLEPECSEEFFFFAGSLVSFHGFRTTKNGCLRHLWRAIPATTGPGRARGKEPGFGFRQEKRTRESLSISRNSNRIDSTGHSPTENARMNSSGELHTALGSAPHSAPASLPTLPLPQIFHCMLVRESKEHWERFHKKLFNTLRVLPAQYGRCATHGQLGRADVKAATAQRSWPARVSTSIPMAHFHGPLLSLEA